MVKNIHFLAFIAVSLFQGGFTIASHSPELIEDRFPRIKLEWELKKMFRAQDVTVSKVWRRMEAYNPIMLWGETSYRSFGFLMKLRGRDVQVRCDWDDFPSRKELRISSCLVLRGGGPWDLPPNLAYGSEGTIPYAKLGMNSLNTVAR